VRRGVIGIPPAVGLYVAEGGEDLDSGWVALSLSKSYNRRRICKRDEGCCVPSC